MSPDLSQAEIDAICEPLTQHAAQVRFLRRLGLVVARAPSGRPLVNRKHYDAVRGREPIEARAAADEPAWGAA